MVMLFDEKIPEGNKEMILFTGGNAKKFDDYLINSVGYTIDLLVEQAGNSIAFAVEKFLCSDINIHKFPEINIFAGKGNNGLDAFACGRILSAQNYNVRIWEVFEDEIDIDNDSVQKILCLNANISIENASGYLGGSNQIIIDGIFGVSFNMKRGVGDYYKSIFQRINESSGNGSYIFSIDVPSGVDSDTGEKCEDAVKADETITFIYPKPGIISYPGRENAGQITVDKINIPAIIIDNYVKLNGGDIKYSMTDIEFAKRNILPREKDSHKGSFGKVGIFGGSKGMAGAVCISAMSAAKSGAGLVYMTVPDEIYADCLKVIPEALISSDYDLIFNNPDVVAIGPGLSETDYDAEKIIQIAIENFPKLILDAGALNIISKNISRYLSLFEKRRILGLPPAILTPHPGEIKRLLQGKIKDNRIVTAKYTAEIFNSIIVYKGAGTVIAGPDGTVYINTSGNSALARGGSGDVLTGIIASFYSANESGIKASAAGVYIHGLSGDITADEFTEISSSVDDIMRNLPKAYKMILEGDKDICKITY